MKMAMGGKLPFANPAQGDVRLGSRLRVKNGYRSVTICAGWSEDALDFIRHQLECHRA